MNCYAGTFEHFKFSLIPSSMIQFFLVRKLKLYTLIIIII